MKITTSLLPTYYLALYDFSGWLICVNSFRLIVIHEATMAMNPKYLLFFSKLLLQFIILS
jgi:hypothetical protein